VSPISPASLSCLIYIPCLPCLPMSRKRYCDYVTGVTDPSSMVAVAGEVVYDLTSTGIQAIHPCAFTGFSTVTVLILRVRWRRGDGNRGYDGGGVRTGTSGGLLVCLHAVQYRSSHSLL
jgi:hypothetical protein